MAFFEFPNARTFDSDLTWLIDFIKNTQEPFNTDTENKLNSALSSINAINETLYNLNVPNYLAGKYLIILGDSNAAGEGWWINPESRNPENDGVAAYLRINYSMEVTNLAQSGAGFMKHGSILSLYQQAQQIPDGADPDYICMWALGNDVVTYMTTNGILGNPQMDVNEITSAFTDNTILGGVRRVILYLQERFPRAKLLIFFRPPYQNLGVAEDGVKTSIYYVARNLGVPVYDCGWLNLYKQELINKYLIMTTAAMHFNSACFNDILGPIFVALLTSNFTIVNPPECNEIALMGTDFSNTGVLTVLNNLYLYKNNIFSFSVGGVVLSQTCLSADLHVKQWGTSLLSGLIYYQNYILAVTQGEGFQNVKALQQNPIDS